MAKREGWYGIEARFVSHYIAENFPRCLTWKRVRLGPARFTEEEKLYQILRRWADAVVFDGAKVYIIEAKIRPKPEGVAQLELYTRLFPQTPEFYQLRDMPVVGIYLTALTDKGIKELCEEKGFRYVVYQPDFIKEYFLKKYGYELPPEGVR